MDPRRSPYSADDKPAPDMPDSARVRFWQDISAGSVPGADPLERAEERREREKDRWRVLFGLGNFTGVVVACILILILFALIVSLLTWLIRDAGSTFSVLGALLK